MKTVKLGSLGEIFIGLTYKPDEIADDGTIVLRSSNIQNGCLDFDDIVRVKCNIKDKLYVRENDILMCSRNGSAQLVGKCTLIPKLNEVMTFGAFMTIIRTPINSFIRYYFDSDNFRKQVKGSATTTINQITRSMLEEIEIPFYKAEEQQKIAITLTKIYDLISLRKQQLSKLDELVKSRFIELFGDQESNPFGWEQCSIGECCTLKSGTSLPAEVENEGGSIPYVKVGDMNYPGNERYITTSSRYVSEETAGKGLFEVGSIIFPKRGGAIGTNKKRMTKLPICADLNVMGVSSNGQLLPEYLLAYFDMIDLGALSDGSSVPQINNKNIAPLVICVPPMDLQKQFATFVEQTGKSKSKIQKSLEQIETLKKALMQKYFG